MSSQKLTLILASIFGTTLFFTALILLDYYLRRYYRGYSIITYGFRLVKRVKEKMLIVDDTATREDGRVQKNQRRGVGDSRLAEEGRHEMRRERVRLVQSSGSSARSGSRSNESGSGTGSSEGTESSSSPSRSPPTSSSSSLEGRDRSGGSGGRNKHVTFPAHPKRAYKGSGSGRRAIANSEGIAQMVQQLVMS